MVVENTMSKKYQVRGCIVNESVISFEEEINARDGSLGALEDSVHSHYLLRVQIDTSR
jgi:hypothetical protein